MWQRQETLSSSDESYDEEILSGISCGFETAATSSKLKPVVDNIFADIKASIPSLTFEDSSEVRSHLDKLDLTLLFFYFVRHNEQQTETRSWRLLFLRQRIA